MGYSIKKNTLIVIDLIKKSLSLCNLNADESKGFVSSLTKLRFLPYTRVTVPFSLGRTIRGLSFKENLMHDPYGKLALGIAEGIDKKILFKTILDEMKRESQINAAEIVLLNDNTRLKKFPAWAVVMPWERSNVEWRFKTYPESFYKNRSKNDLNFENSSRSSIIKSMYSAKSAESKVNQMSKIYNSIKSNKLKLIYPLPKINIMINGDEWRWFMSDAGNHRSYICACFDFEFFDASINSIINKNDLNSWPNVTNGTYSPKEAEYIFDSFFDGSTVFRGIV